MTEIEVKHDEQAGKYYAVVDGRLTVSQGDKADVIGYLRTGDFFGERGLLENATRRATVLAPRPTHCATLRSHCV